MYTHVHTDTHTLAHTGIAFTKGVAKPWADTYWLLSGVANPFMHNLNKELVICHEALHVCELHFPFNSYVNAGVHEELSTCLYKIILSS